MQRPKLFKPQVFKAARSHNGRAAIDALYKGEWANYSRAFLKNNPRCFSCGEGSEATDHLRVHLGNLALFYSKENHIPLCHKCHNFITNKFDRKIPQDYEGKLRWLAANRARNQLTFSIKVTPWKFPVLKVD